MADKFLFALGVSVASGLIVWFLTRPREDRTGTQIVTVAGLRG